MDIDTQMCDRLAARVAGLDDDTPVTLPAAQLRQLLGAVGSPPAPYGDPLHQQLDERELGAVAVDPPGCGCTECLVGTYVPADEASQALLARVYAGLVRDHTHAGIVRRVTDGRASYRAR